MTLIESQDNLELARASSQASVCRNQKQACPTHPGSLPSTSRSSIPLGHSSLRKLTCWKGLWKALPNGEEMTRLRRGRHNSLVTTLVRSGLTIPKNPDTCARKSWHLLLVTRPGSDLWGVIIKRKCRCEPALQPSGTVAAGCVLLRIGAALARRKRSKRGFQSEGQRQQNTTASRFPFP